MTRGSCPECRRWVGVRLDGTLRGHTGSLPVAVCRGSWKLPMEVHGPQSVGQLVEGRRRLEELEQRTERFARSLSEALGKPSSKSGKHLREK